jgi:outer membrane protein TolC
MASAPAHLALPAPAVVRGGLTADEVARRAAATSFDVRARAKEREAAEAAVAGARAAFVPRLTGTARYARLSAIEQPSLGTIVVAPNAPAGPLSPGAPLLAVPLDFPSLENQYLLQASLTVPLSDYLLRLPQLAAGAEAARRSAALTERASRLQAETDGRVAYYGWARALWQLAVARQTREQTQARLRDVERAAEAGAASPADVLRVRSQAAAAQVLVTRAEALATALEQQLRVAMHEAEPRPFALGEPVEAEVRASAPVDPAGLEELFAEAQQRRLEVRALEAAAGGLRDQARAARAAGLPRLDAVGTALQANPHFRFVPQQPQWRGTWEVSLQVTWSPTDLFGSEAGRRGLEARAEALDAQRMALIDALKVEVTRAANALREAVAAQDGAAEGLAAAEEGYRVRRLLAENGRATTVELVDAETELLRARLDVVAARLDARIAQVRLHHALGRNVED